MSLESCTLCKFVNSGVSNNEKNYKSVFKSTIYHLLVLYVSLACSMLENIFNSSHFHFFTVASVFKSIVLQLVIIVR